MSHTSAFISIIIVNYNGAQWLQPCIDSLKAQLYRNIEIIVVDNASTDDSVHILQTQYPEVTIITNKSNLGFAEGNNIGARHARGEYVFLLNTDTVCSPYTLCDLASFLDKNKKVACVQPTLLLAHQKDTYDLIGAYWTNTTVLYHHGLQKNIHDIPQVNGPFFSLKGAAMLIRASIIQQVGLFDPTYWCYFEETDFCHRCLVAGWECWSIVADPVYHVNGATSKQTNQEKIQFHNFKNKLRSYIKNFELHTLYTVIPAHIIFTCAYSILLLPKKPKVAYALFRSVVWNITHLNETLRYRQAVQKARRVSDTTYLMHIKKSPSLEYYLSLFI